MEKIKRGRRRLAAGIMNMLESLPAFLLVVYMRRYKVVCGARARGSVCVCVRGATVMWENVPAPASGSGIPERKTHPKGT